MTSTTIRQPATTETLLPARPVRFVALAKLFGLVVVIGTAVALVIAGGVGLAAALLTHATG